MGFNNLKEYLERVKLAVAQREAESLELGITNGNQLVLLGGQSLELLERILDDSKWTPYDEKEYRRNIERAKRDAYERGVTIVDHFSPHLLFRLGILIQ